MYGGRISCTDGAGAANLRLRIVDFRVLRWESSLRPTARGSGLAVGGDVMSPSDFLLKTNLLKSRSSRGT